MGKYQCPHCGHIQDRDGVCEGCDLSKVLPIHSKQTFIKGVRYKCSSCNRSFRSYYEACPNCGTGKLVPQYKNHKRLKKSSKIIRFVLTVFIIAAFIFGAHFVLHNYFPDTEVNLNDTLSAKAAELRTWAASYISGFAQRGIKSPVSNEGNVNDQQIRPQLVALPKALSVGDTATLGGLEITIKRMAFSDYAGDMELFGRIDSDYKYCVVYLDAYNPTNETIAIKEESENSSSAFTFEAVLQFDGEVYYAHSYGYNTGFFFGNGEVLPRATITDKVINFKVPTSITESDAPLVIFLRDRSKDIASWKLR